MCNANACKPLRGAKIPDQRRMPALLEMRSQDVKDQMLMRLDEIAENDENLKTKFIKYFAKKEAQSRVEQCDTSGSVDVARVWLREGRRRL